MVLRRRILVAIVALLAATSVFARTWRVEKDGTGDFTILYEAADACAAGDTILVGPGRFEEYRREPDYVWRTYCCIHVDVPEVTIIGSGRDVTAIGFEHFDPHYPVFVIGVSGLHQGLTIKNLTVGGVHEGIHFEGPSIHVEDCNIVETDVGLVTWSSLGTTLRQCRILSSQHYGVLGARANGVSITDCEFADGSRYAIAGVGGAGWEVRNCEFHNYTGGIQFEQGASGVIANCLVQLSGGNAPAIGLLEGCAFSLYDNEFSGGNWAGSFATVDRTVIARRNIFVGGAWTTLEIRCPVDFQQNHIINGGGPSVLAWWARGTLSQPAEIDLSGHFWGTDDSAQIATWIDDYNDYPPTTTDHFVIVKYEPFSGQPVPTEQKTWGTVKSLFR